MGRGKGSRGLRPLGARRKKKKKKMMRTGIIYMDGCFDMMHCTTAQLVVGVLSDPQFTIA
ncbi:unnamed protein product [Camellia sinensis]